MFVASNWDVEIESRYTEEEEGERRNIILLIIIIIFSFRRGKFGSGKGNLIPVSRSRKVCLHHPQGASCCSGVSLSLPLRRRALLTVTYRLTDLWPGRRPRAGRSQTFCSPLLRGLIALTRSYYIIPTLLIFINLISRARVSFVYRPPLYQLLSLLLLLYANSRKTRDRYEVVRVTFSRGSRIFLTSFVFILVLATVDGVDRVEEVGTLREWARPLHRYTRLRAWTLRVLRRAEWIAERELRTATTHLETHPLWPIIPRANEARARNSQRLINYNNVVNFTRPTRNWLLTESSESSLEAPLPFETSLD